MKLQAATGRPQNSEQDLGKKFPFSCDHINKKGIRSKIKKNKNKNKEWVKVKGLDAHDWKQCLSDEALSPNVLLAIILNKIKI